MVLVQLAYLLQIINLGITIAQKKLNKILFTILYVISVFFMQGYPIVIAVLGSYVKQNIKSSYGDIGLSIAGSAVDKSLSAMQNSLGVGYYIFMGMAVLILIVLILDMKAVRGKLGHLNWYCWIFGDAEDVETANSAGTNGSSGTNGSGGTAGGGTYGSSGTNGGGSYGSSGTNGGGTNGSSGTNGGGANGSSGTNGGGANGSSGINGGGTNGSSGTNGGGTSGSGIAGEPNEVVGKLHVLNGRYGNLYIDIQDGERITIGRDPGQCNLVLEAPNISSVHCDVIFEGGVFYVIDHSMNGTFYLLSSNNNKVRLQKDVKESISVGKTISITENGVRIRLEI
jgi:hypothetical protein